MNDKIRRFTTQLSDAAPLAPELEGRTIPASGSTFARSPLTSSPITALRIGVAIAAVGVLGLVAVIVSANDDRGAVIPASGQTSAAISDAIQAVLPDGFRLEFVERRDSPDAAPAHAVAVNDRLEVLDIDFMALNQVVEDTQPGEISPDTEPTENVSSGELVTDTTVACITRTSTPDAAECLEYADEGTAVTLSPPDTSDSNAGAGAQPQCYTFDIIQESSSPTISIPCSLEQSEGQELDSQEIAKSNRCTVYVRSAPDVPPVIQGCPQVTVIIDPSLVASTITVAGTSPPTSSTVTETMVPGDGSSTVEEGTSPVYDAFGPDRNGMPSPFQGASTTTSQVFVTVTHYSLQQGLDVGGLSALIASSLEQIPNLAEAIALLPEPLAPADLNMSSPVTGAWTTASMTSGSLSVSLWRGLTDGAVIVQISYPGSIEASGNDGDVFWQALTPSAGDGRVSIVHLQRGSRDALTDADAAALAYKIADAWTDARDVILGINQDVLVVPAGGDQPPVTEAPVDLSVPELSVPELSVPELSVP